MLILLVAVFSIGLIALGIWLHQRQANRIRGSATNPQQAATLRENADLVESGRFSGANAIDGIQKSSQGTERGRSLAGEPSGSGPSKTKAGSRIKTEQAPSPADNEDEKGIPAIDAPSEYPPENMSGATQTDGESWGNQTEYVVHDAERQSGDFSDEGGETPVTRRSTDGEEEEPEGRTAIDESVGGSVDCGHVAIEKYAENFEADRVSVGELGGDTGVVVGREEIGRGRVKVQTKVPTSQRSATREEGLGTAVEGDSEAGGQADEKDISIEATSSDKVRPGLAAPSEETENADLNRGPDAQLSGNFLDFVEDTENNAGGEPAETEARTLRARAIRDGKAETKAGSESETDYNGASRSIGENARAGRRRKQQSAVYRDRRGVRRADGKTLGKSLPSPSPPAEVRLRLMLDLVQRTTSLSVILMRPEGFPERIQPLWDGEGPVDAFDTSRYDDLAIAWTGDLLSGELRIKSEEGQQWLRAARAVHIFAENPAEPGMISVGTARADVPHAVVCKADDEEIVRDAAVATGSRPLVSHDLWHGIPYGCVVLSDYRPRYAARAALPLQFSPLDPGTEVEISLTGGLRIRGEVYGEGSPPTIGIEPMPDGTSVSIGGVPAKQAPDGAWEADGWDSRGHHLIDVVPGPSLTYQIMADPTANGEWMFWDAHPERFGADSNEPWGRVGICGAAVRGPDGETVVAAANLPILVALGERGQVVPLTPRGHVPASVAIMSEAPCFLVAATGLRRKHGRIVWLGSNAKRGVRHPPDQHWAGTVRSIAARRLRLEGADDDGARAWRNAKQRARRIWRNR